MVVIILLVSFNFTVVSMTDPILDVLRPQPTGGLVVTFKQDADLSTQIGTLENAVGAGVRSYSATLESAAEFDDSTPALVLEDVGIAVISEQAETASAQDALMASDTTEDVRPEFWMFDASPPFDDTADRTWGIAATGAETSPQTGEGIKICVLDTGLDLNHQDYVGRNITSRSFVPNETVQDVQGHGTHCAGTAAGRTNLAGVPRYGVAPEAELFVGKVLNNSGSGRERDILAGMLWGIQQGCEVISMSLGRSVRPGETHSLEYERLGQMALNSNSLIIAAAGNDSRRNIGFIAPVNAPGNSPSIMAVAALDQNLAIAEFSCGGINADGGEVDIAAPGVAVFSSSPSPRNYRPLRGTSMACPHVAGLAALWAQCDVTLRGRDLWQKLAETSVDVQLPARDVGVGLAKAPSGLVS